MKRRNPVNRQVAIVGIGATEYTRHGDRSRLSLGVEASRLAIEDAGLGKQDIDGIAGCGSGLFGFGDANFLALQEAFDFPAITWMVNYDLAQGPVHAAYAVNSGACDVALVVHVQQRGPGMSASARRDPLRVRASRFENLSPKGFAEYAQRWCHTGEAYSAWAGRYMHDYGAPRETFGMLSVNNRSHASRNPAAMMRTPMTMDDYLASRYIWEPFCLLDMDLPVDMAEAMIVTTAERAASMKHKPVFFETAALGQAPRGKELYENGPAWGELAPWVAMKAMWDRSDLTLDDIDLFFPYDGYTINAVAFTEAAGWCGLGEAKDLFRDSWDEDEQILRLRGKTLVSTNGGGLSHGRANGFNFYTEAVRQIRGEAGERQVPGASSALIGTGSFYHDPSAATLVG